MTPDVTDDNNTDPFGSIEPDPAVRERFAALEARERAKREAERASQPVVPPSVPNPAADTGVKEYLKALPLLDFYLEHFKPLSHKEIQPPRHLVSCFNHIFHSNGDKKPQLDINTAKNVYYCHACEVRGDIIDLLAVKYGQQDSDNRCPNDKVDTVIEYAALELLPGQTYRNVSGVRVFAEKAEPESFPVYQMGTKPAQTEAQFLAENAQNTATLPPNAQIPDLDDVNQFDYGRYAPTLDWKKAVHPQGFVARYMELVQNMDSPDEFHLYNAFIALSLAVGRDIQLVEARNVLANVFICDMGPSGMGKSGSGSVLKEVVREAFPYIESTGKGVNIPGEAGSGEALIDVFHPVYMPPVAPGTPRNQMPMPVPHDNIRALVDYNELSALMARASRQGNTLNTVLMKLYDGDTHTSTLSRTHGNVTAENAFCSLLTTSQPALIGEMIKASDAASGFANRFLFVFGKPKSRNHRSKALPPRSSVVAHLKEIAAWADQVKKAHGGQIGALDWDDDADKLYAEFFHTHIDKLEISRDLYGRFNLALKKHILWLCIDEQSFMVTRDIVQRVITHFWPYIYGCAQLVNGQLPERQKIMSYGEKEDRALAGVKRYYDKYKDWPTVAALKRHILGKNWSTTEVARCLDDLTKHGILSVIPPKAGVRGQPQKRYKIETVD